MSRVHCPAGRHRGRGAPTSRRTDLEGRRSDTTTSPRCRPGGGRQSSPAPPPNSSLNNPARIIFANILNAGPTSVQLPIQESLSGSSFAAYSSHRPSVSSQDSGLSRGALGRPGIPRVLTAYPPHSSSLHLFLVPRIIRVVPPAEPYDKYDYENPDTPP